MDKHRGWFGHASVTAISLLMAAAAASACQSAVATAAPSPSATVPSSPTPSPSPSPEPTPDMAKLGRQYLALINAGNAITCAGNARMAAAPSDLSVYTGAYADFARADRAVADGLRCRLFPPAVQVHIDQMIVNLAASEAVYLSIARANTWELADSFLAEAKAANAATVATSNLIRGDLHLASVPRSC